jgi:lipopolysaccharide/colanic/teichoic acid biosynthesis glycosyltransferase
MLMQTQTKPAAPARPTIWGLTPVQVHDRFWAARGTQVVRPGVQSNLVDNAELFMLSGPELLTIFRLRQVVEQLSWVSPRVMWVRLRDSRDHGYREHVQLDDDGRFVNFRRIYRDVESRLARVALTRDRDLAEMWQQMPDARTGWQRLRETVPRERRWSATLDSRNFSAADDHEVMNFMTELMKQWQTPTSTIARARHLRGTVLVDRDSELPETLRSVGTIWVGAGRRIDASANLVGPAILWDNPEHEAPAAGIDWAEIQKSEIFVPKVKPRTRGRLERFVKRGFDIVFSLLVLLIILPIFPLVMLAIWLEDGRPFFFAHRRETRGGREFPCLKFRSMRKDAEAIKERLATQNQADGPQFFMEDDPRLTRVGKFIRKCQIDELPQFLNVLAGDMSVVGPRPSPRKENQCCPPWREARLSVLPGVTGLWQVKRSRRAGEDFQEWIKYDIEYVENANFGLDLWIIYQTIVHVLLKRK